MIDFPANPTVGQQFTAAGVTWTWDGTKWTASGLGVAYLPLAGGTMLGPIVLAADPVAPLQAATAQYADRPRYGDNRIINGNFAVNQRAYVSGTALAAAAYGHDRWKAGAAGCTCTFTAALPDTTITITAGTLTQIIEAGMIEGGVYTLSWTGTAQARVYQGAPSGSYAASPVVTAALPAGVNTIVEFNTGTVVRVKLEIGSVSTPFNRQTMTKSLADCQRYYQVYTRIIVGGYSAAGNPVYEGFLLPAAMRANPTVTFGTPTYGNASALAVNSLSTQYMELMITVTTVGWGSGSGAPTTLNAEL